MVLLIMNMNLIYLESKWFKINVLINITLFGMMLK
jgi:hypothetical protein